MTTLEVLEAARKKIKQGWCQGSGAKSAFGSVVSFNSVHASRWCAAAAIDISCDYTPGAFTRAREIMVSMLGVDNLAAWNDTPGRTQAEVLAAFDRAIGLAKAA